MVWMDVLNGDALGVPGLAWGALRCSWQDGGRDLFLRDFE